jgi:hypothetical protein
MKHIATLLMTVALASSAFAGPMAAPMNPKAALVLALPLTSLVAHCSPKALATTSLVAVSA